MYMLVAALLVSYLSIHVSLLIQHNKPKILLTRISISKLKSSEIADASTIEKLTENLKNLKLEREKKKSVLAATEMAIRSLENEINTMSKKSSNPIIFDTSLDYGFISKSSGCYVNTTTKAGESGVPTNAISLGIQSLKRELESIKEGWLGSKEQSKRDSDPMLQKLSQLSLSNKAIWDREELRPPVKAPFIIKIPYLLLCYLLDVLFEGNPISRFWFLETVARMPYFSYITMLHTYETLGWWRRSAEAKRVHFAEEWNEFHHLLIMESLGGDQKWAVRFFAQHAAIVYFFVLISLWITSPSLAYNFSELIEAHAVDTYAEFAESNKEILQQLPPPMVAKAYYEGSDMYTFDEFQTSRPKGSRRPKINNLYDVFCNIRDDEAEHVATMAACQDPSIVVRSPNAEAAFITAALVSLGIAYLTSSETIDVSALTKLIDSIGSNAAGTSAGFIESASNTITDLAPTAEQVSSSLEQAGAVMTEVSTTVMEESPNSEEFIQEITVLGIILRFIRPLLPFL